MIPIKNIPVVELLPVVFTIVLAVSLSACSSKQSPDVKPIFHSEIKADDSKFFHFYLLITRNHTQEKGEEKPKGDARPSKGNGKGRGSGAGKGGKGGRTAKSESTDSMPKQEEGSRENKRSELMSALLLEHLNDKLEQNNYCRQGYMVLQESIGKGILSIKGECHESATEKDRSKFPNRKLSKAAS